ncbi:hypothetical protein R5R35_001490 [Gryllus longicercus]|uniref:Uncharacterized protein n=1 Tax=Gryllus longicercus TaxID=2509291 RepID=A0AAN9ZAC0_9ORTH
MSTAKRLVLSLRGGRRGVGGGGGGEGAGAGAGAGSASSSTRLVLDHPHGPGGHYGGAGSVHELDEIAVVSANAEPCHLKYGSGPLGVAANGPRVVPGEPSPPLRGERTRVRGFRAACGCARLLMKTRSS